MNKYDSAKIEKKWPASAPKGLRQGKQKYNSQKIEKYWQKHWKATKLYKTGENSKKPKYYVLDMFPYPSGAGLHVGHPKGYIATDVAARMKMMQGFNVLHPMGWDAFGLPAENYAIKNKVHPSIATAKNVQTFKKQLELLGFTYDWDREVNTTDPEYYKWTQWAFLQMFKHGLAYESYEPVNWCPVDKTVLANEDLENGKCERCGSEVEQKPMRQWVLKITDYADRLLKDIDKLSAWPEPIREMQKNWIGRSEGINFKHKIKDLNIEFEVYDSIPQTYLAQTFFVIAPEHKLVDTLVVGTKYEKLVKEFVEKIKKKKASNKFDVDKEKEGIFTGRYVENYLGTGRDLPIWVASFALADYGTGIVGCSAHDERDWEFAKKYNLPLRPVLFPKDEGLAAKVRAAEIFYRESDGILEEPVEFKGMRWDEAREPIIEYIVKNNLGKRAVNYKLRDWVFSRQRYWGEPIPLVKCEVCAKKKPKILHIHGIHGNNTENWIPWLREIMTAKGYEVITPNLPNNVHPTLEEWLKALEDLHISKGDRLFVIGHSLGAPTACQFVLRHGGQVEKLILVAPTGEVQCEKNWENLKKAGCDKEGLECIRTFNRFNNNLGEIKKLVGESVIYLSDNDPYIPLEVTENYKELGAKVRIFKNRGHFNTRAGVLQLPEILEEFPKNLNSGWIPVPEKDLPLELPKVKNYEPSGTGESPLATIDKWVNTKCPQCGGPAKRETNTMPQWAGSCWYYLRYCDPKNKKSLIDKEIEKYWNPVDLYVGGAEHATRHLIYARFWHKFLFDIGVVSNDEPFTKLQNVGLILAEDGRKMSKRWNNVINPDEIAGKFGADAMRVYEMFMGPFDQPCAWSTNGVIGCRRFLEKVWGLQEKVSPTVILSKAKDLDSSASPQNDKRIETLLHQTIKKVTEDIGNIRFNTAVAQMMSLVNEFSKEEKITRSNFEMFIKILSPFAPHICEEIWEKLCNKESIFKSDWPQYDAGKIKDASVTLVVQVNGRLRDTLEVSADIAEADAKQLALSLDKVQKWLEGKEPKKVIYVKGKLVSIVV